jgi:hypothetical protein
MLIQAQRSVITQAFSDADAFCKRVCQDLKIELKLPRQLRGSTVSSVSDLSFADLIPFWSEILKANKIPDSAVASPSYSPYQLGAFMLRIDNQYVNAPPAAGWTAFQIVSVRR